MSTIRLSMWAGALASHDRALISLGLMAEDSGEHYISRGSKTNGISWHIGLQKSDGSTHSPIVGGALLCSYRYTEDDAHNRLTERTRILYDVLTLMKDR